MNIPFSCHLAEACDGGRRTRAPRGECAARTMSFMDARDVGSKVGGGGVASAQASAIDRRERLRRLALETIDLAKDPYFMKNHLGRCVVVVVIVVGDSA
jgi:hypothetical protein